MSDTPDLETHLREQLAEIRRRADEEAAPIIEKLTAIEAAKPRVPFVFNTFPGHEYLQWLHDQRERETCQNGRESG